MSVVFRIHLRHIASGLEQAFNDRQEIADFFATHARDQYEGWENLGKLPDPTLQALREAAEGGDTILEGREILEAWAGGQPDYSDAEDRANRTDLGAVPEGEAAGTLADQGFEVNEATGSVNGQLQDYTGVQGNAAGEIAAADVAGIPGVEVIEHPEGEPKTSIDTTENPVGSQSDASGQPDGVEGTKADPDATLPGAPADEGAQANSVSTFGQEPQK